MSPGAAYALGVIVGCLFVVVLIAAAVDREREERFLVAGDGACPACGPRERVVFVVLPREATVHEAVAT